MKKLFLTVALTLFTSAAFGQGLYITDAGIGGNGCPQGSFDYVLSPDQTKISVLFDDYIAESNRRMVRKSCNIAVGVHVPPGLQVSWVTLDYRGYVFVPYGGSAVFTASYFFAGRRVGSTFRSEWYGGDEEDFTLSDDFGLVTWSACGEDVIMRANTASRVRGRGSRDATYLQVDSVDAAFGLLFTLRKRPCR